MKLCFTVFHSSHVNITHNGMVTLQLFIVELEVAVTRWLITQDGDLYSTNRDLINVLIVVGTTRKSIEIAVQSNLTSS
jgi:hypothetical protein